MFRCLKCGRIHHPNVERVERNNAWCPFDGTPPGSETDGVEEHVRSRGGGDEQVREALSWLPVPTDC